MKKLIAAALLCASGAAIAAGPLDGIYVNLNGGFGSVHSNGSSIFVIGLSQVPASGIYFSSVVGTVRPTSVDQWDYASGVINGSVADVSGVTMYGACTFAARITFTAGSAVLQITGAANTLVGNASGVNCRALTSLPASTLLKAF